jgi:hypothetical protein
MSLTTIATAAGAGLVAGPWLPDLAPTGRIDLAGSEGGMGRPQLQFVNGQLLVLGQAESSVQASMWDVRTLRRLAGPVTVPMRDERSTGGSRPSVIVARPGTAELVEREGTRVRRVRLSDGAAVPGSEFSVASNTNGQTWQVPEVVDGSGRFLAFMQSGAVEVWDLESRQRVGRLPVPQGVNVSDLQFGADPDQVEVSETMSTDAVLAVELWTRRAGVLGWFGIDHSTLRVVRNPSPTQVAVDYADLGKYYAVESTDPQAWLDTACRVWYPDPAAVGLTSLPDGAWSASVCPSR